MIIDVTGLVLIPGNCGNDCPGSWEYAQWKVVAAEGGGKQQFTRLLHLGRFQSPSNYKNTHTKWCGYFVAE